jgi:hypothetical protein
MDETANTIEVNEATTAAAASAVRVSRFDVGLWLVVCVSSSVMIALVKWPTFLGINSLPWLHVGHDYPWRVWWRARDQYLNTSHHLALYLVFGAALAIVFFGTALAGWLLLTHTNDEPGATADS